MAIYFLKLFLLYISVCYELIPILSEIMLNVYYTKYHTLNFTRQLIHTYTPSSYNYNCQSYNPLILPTYFKNKQKYLQNLNLPTYVHVLYKPYYKNTHLCYTHKYKYTRCYMPYIPQLTSTEFIRTLINLPRAAQLFDILYKYPKIYKYPSCNPKSSKLISING